MVITLISFLQGIEAAESAGLLVNVFKELADRNDRLEKRVEHLEQELQQHLKTEIDYELTKRHVMALMSMPSEDKISQGRKQTLIEEMIKLRQSIEAGRKEVNNLS